MTYAPFERPTEFSDDYRQKFMVYLKDLDARNMTDAQNRRAIECLHVLEQRYTFEQKTIDALHELSSLDLTLMPKAHAEFTHWHEAAKCALLILHCEKSTEDTIAQWHTRYVYSKESPSELLSYIGNAVYKCAMFRIWDAFFRVNGALNDRNEEGTVTDVQSAITTAMIKNNALMVHLSQKLCAFNDSLMHRHGYDSNPFLDVSTPPVSTL